MAYEVEIKSLLGTKENALRFKNYLTGRTGKKVLFTSSSNQLNHYFENGNLENLYKELEKYLRPAARKQMKEMIAKATKISIRTRQTNDQVKFVIKASVGKDSSSNGVARLELEEPVKMTLDALDKKVLKAGYHYQAKWSRERDEFQVDGITVCLDKNAGYGYLVEFEKVLHTTKQISKAKDEIRSFMKTLKVSELPQARLERMFGHYNKNWPDFYGTDNVFTLK
jgi:adenylate cyclase class IV